MHESVHAWRGPVLTWMEGREERAVRHETARRLISLDDLIEVLQATSDARVAAGWLEVPEAVIWARLQGLTPSERLLILARLGETDD